jgi:hypothetical protein
MPRQIRVERENRWFSAADKNNFPQQKLSPPYESPKEPKEQAKKPWTIFLRIRISICIRIRTCQLADAKRADFSAQHVNQSVFSLSFTVFTAEIREYRH